MKGKIKRIKASVDQVLEVTHINKISLHAASACYFLVLAAFPLLVLVLSILRYTPLELQTLIELLDGLVPAALMGGWNGWYAVPMTVVPRRCCPYPSWRLCGPRAAAFTV